MYKDDRTPEEAEATIGFVTATDKFMSGWGYAPGKSKIAVPFTNEVDKQKVLATLESRSEMKYINVVGPKYRPKLSSGDHFHIYNTVNSFRY